MPSGPKRERGLVGLPKVERGDIASVLSVLRLQIRLSLMHLGWERQGGSPPIGTIGCCDIVRTRGGWKRVVARLKTTLESKRGREGGGAMHTYSWPRLQMNKEGLFSLPVGKSESSLPHSFRLLSSLAACLFRCWLTMWVSQLLSTFCPMSSICPTYVQ